MLLNKIVKSQSKNVYKKNTVDNGRLITFLNPYSYLVARKRVLLFNRFDLYVDGVLLVAMLRLVGFRLERLSFDMTSVAPKVFEHACEHDLSIYFIGGEPGIAETAVSVFSAKYARLQIAGIRHGYFSGDEEKAEVIQSIVMLKPDIVLASMGAPHQEEFLAELADSGWKGVGYTCGGFFHQTAKGGLSYYPKWMDKFHLRWLFRMIDEPKLLPRYFVYYPLFVFVFFYDLVSLKKNGGF